jgi:uncharacterized protein (TIGR03435 family)
MFCGEMSPSNTFLKVLLLSAAMAAHFVCAQEPVMTSVVTDMHPAFDVVSVIPARPGRRWCNSDFSADSYVARGCTLRSMLQDDVYDTPGPQILGIPAKLNDMAFDIRAKLDPDTYARMKALPKAQFDQQLNKMLQQLFADRFRLVVHTEKRQLSVYALVVAKGGTKMKRAEEQNRPSNIGAYRGELTAQHASMAGLAEFFTLQLERELGRAVVDQTGVKGRYDFTMNWTPETHQTSIANGQEDSGTGPSIFTAIQEQLGLKLRSTKDEVKVLVVDHVEAPSEN